MASFISVEIAPGELIDKITILEIKLERISNPEKLENVRKEWLVLTEVRDTTIKISDQLRLLSDELKTINEMLWKIEDDIRDCERNKDFGETFITLARSVYKTNDERAQIKHRINHILGSKLVEEKSYTAY